MKQVVEKSKQSQRELEEQLEHTVLFPLWFSENSCSWQWIGKSYMEIGAASSASEFMIVLWMKIKRQ